MATMREVYRDAQTGCGLKFGDYVKIIKSADDYECGWNGIWSETKSKTIGKIGRIIGIQSNSITVSGRELGGTFDYPYFVLEKVENPKPKFKSFDKVLVRDSKKDNWRCDIYSHMDNAGIHHCAGKGNWWQYCISYEGNEHLVGTTDIPENIL